MQFKNEITWMDVFAMLLSSGIGVWLLTLSDNVGDNTVRITGLEAGVQRVERQAREDQKAITDRMDGLATEVRAYRLESKEDNQRIQDKLDRLIERSLENR